MNGRVYITTSAPWAAGIGRPGQTKADDERLLSITAFEADDGHWEGEGVKNGKKMQFHADPKTGVILSEKPNN